MMVTRSGSSALAGWACRQWAGPLGTQVVTGTSGADRSAAVMSGLRLYYYFVTQSQAEIAYYRLELRPGYRHQYSDCMVCDHTGGPLILRTDSLLPDSPRPLATLDTALTTRRPMLACPDMMFLTRFSLS